MCDTSNIHLAIKILNFKDMQDFHAIFMYYILHIKHFTYVSLQ